MFLDSFEPRPLATATLLELWSAGAATTAPDRARAILRAAFPPEVEPQLDALPLGEWNTGLLRVQRLQFGNTFVLTDRCPHCGEAVELRLAGDTLRPPVPDPGHRSSPPLLEVDDCVVRYRLLTGGDWRAALQEPASDATEAGVRLLRRAVVEVTRNGQPVTPGEISPSAWESLAEAVTAADPWSEILFALHCPHCRGDWESLLELGDYVWNEIAGTAQQSLRQVHRLASAYGWTEAEVLELPPDRRSAYIALLDEDLGLAAKSFDAGLGAYAP